MKPTMALKPLVFALTALMAIAAQASGGGSGGGGGGGSGGGSTSTPTVLAATVNDTQNISGNATLNEKTKNDASTTNTVNSNQGIAQGNVLSGTAVNGKNDVALAAADDVSQVFATVNTNQNISGNGVANIGNANDASTTNTANSNSGIAQVSVASGTNINNSNSVALASASGKSGGATVNAIQNISGNVTLNAVASGHHWSKVPVTNDASTTNTANSNSGVVSVNVSAGTNINAASNVSVVKF